MKAISGASEDRELNASIVLNITNFEYIKLRMQRRSMVLQDTAMAEMEPTKINIRGRPQINCHPRQALFPIDRTLDRVSCRCARTR